MKKYLLFYLIAALGVVIYFLVSMNASPFLRAGILAAVGLFAYIGCITSKNKQHTKIALAVSFVLYLHLLVSMLFLDSYFGRTTVSPSVNLIPFKTISSFFYADTYSFLVNIIGNLVVFMPFAFFLPQLYKLQRKPWIFILTVFAVVAVAEVMQYFIGCGACDIDDLILNVLGAIIAFFVFKPIIKTGA